MFVCCCKDESSSKVVEAVPKVAPIAESAPSSSSAQAVKARAEESFAEEQRRQEELAKIRATANREAERAAEDARRAAHDDQMKMEEMSKAVQTPVEAPLPTPKSIEANKADRDPVQEDFTVCINKSSKEEPLGIELRQGKNALVVRAVVSHAAHKWNKENPSQKIHPGDWLISVNGTSGVPCEKGSAEALLTALRGGASVEMLLRRTRQFFVELRKPSDPMGIKCLKASCVIQEVTEGNHGNPGVIQDYNKTCLPSLEVSPGDEIIAINGERTGPEDLISMISKVKQGEALNLLMKRTPGTPIPEMSGANNGYAVAGNGAR